MPPCPFSIPKMPFDKYRPTVPVELPDRMWPDKRLTKAPKWCSVDLRDGNQALIDPMDTERKMALWDVLVKMGFKEIEVGFPAASQTDFDFIRELIEGDMIPEDVRIQVLTQCREDLIERTFECVQGSHRALIHFYNSTSELQRRVVFGLDQKGITAIATRAAEFCRKFETSLPDTDITYEYSPESFTGTEPKYAVEICQAVMDVIEPTADRPIVINLPATVEMYTPNLYADVIEWFSRTIKHRDRLTLSLHPHNDRGTAVAAAELAQMAGAQRVEGTLFGNGERTGNVDVVTLAMNLFMQGVDPQLDLHDIDALRRAAEKATRLPVHPRHPYAGDLVYTAFSGSHQDAIKKGMKAIYPPSESVSSGTQDYDRWEVPYLPIDPKHVGRTYEEIIRVNSQSGKGGVAYVMDTEHGLDLPRKLQVEFSKVVQSVAESTGKEVKPAQIREVFDNTYMDADAGIRLVSSEVSSGGSTSGDSSGGSGSGSGGSGSGRKGGSTKVTALVLVDGHPQTLVGAGNGPLDALVSGIRDDLGIEISVLDYTEHALTSGQDASAAAYVEAAGAGGTVCWGVGIDSSILDATLNAVISAANRLRGPVPNSSK